MLGSTIFSGMAPSRASTACHWWPCAQALSAEAEETTSGRIPHEARSSNRCNASFHWEARPQAAMAMLDVTRFLLRPPSLGISFSNSITRSHCAPRAHAAIAAPYSTMSGAKPVLRASPSNARAWSHNDQRPNAETPAVRSPRVCSRRSRLRQRCTSSNTSSVDLQRANIAGSGCSRPKLDPRKTGFSSPQCPFEALLCAALPTAGFAQLGELWGRGGRLPP
mmetsp:Transcript_20908/g.72131  ORF Transcript_20908/g.72131 Transcript_20908/m.72131 type:complete len:222 (-) Transcript_20908:214-879(-)